MNAIKPSHKIMTVKSGQDILPFIEACGRTCYKSEAAITQDSAVKFVSGLIHRGHEAMIEHWSYIFKCCQSSYYQFWSVVNALEDLGYTFYLRRTAMSGRYIISGNVRAWRDLIRASKEAAIDLPEWVYVVLTQPTIDKQVFFSDLLDFSEKRAAFTKTKEIWKDELIGFEKDVHYDITIKFTCDRGVTHEIVRHRPASFAQESTRYCNYSKDQFGGEITTIQPFFLCDGTKGMMHWKDSMFKCEANYFKLLNWGCSPQEARSVLPNSLKTEIIMTANIKEWKHFFNLRALGTTGSPHPQMKEVALPAMKEVASLHEDVFDKEVYNAD